MFTLMARCAVAASVAGSAIVANAGQAAAIPDKQFPVLVTCAGIPVQYVSPMLGADAIWLLDTNGQPHRYALVYADDYLGDTLLAQRSYGVKAGYGDAITCTHSADWPFGTVTGTLVLAPSPTGS